MEEERTVRGVQNREGMMEGGLRVDEEELQKNGRCLKTLLAER